MNTQNIVVLASVGGGNFESLVMNQHKHNYCVKKLITNRNCGAIDKAKALGVDYEIIEAKGDVLFKIIESVIPPNTELIVLAGFMPIVPEWFCKLWERKMINIHPSLLPDYGGKGMYGVKVQEAVMSNHEEFAGCTVHYVDSGIDTGDIIEQWKIKVDYALTPWELGGEIFIRGAMMLPLVVDRLLNNKIR